MVWFRVDDGFPTSRKVLSIPKRRRAVAVGVWTMAGAWCARELTDGKLPRYALEEIPNGLRASADLISCGLWIQRGDDFVFHDWAEYQPSKEDVLKERDYHAARQKAYRERKKAERDASLKKDRDASRDSSHDLSRTDARPDPSRPVPTVVPTELPREVKETPLRGKRGQRLPADWQPNPRLIEWVRSECPAVNGRAETERFRDYWIGKSGQAATKVDWDATYRNWMRTAQERTPTGRPTTGVGSTGDQRLAAGQDLVARYEAEEANQRNQIGN